MKIAFAIINVVTVVAFGFALWGWSAFVHLAEPGLNAALHQLPAAVSFAILGLFVGGSGWPMWHARRRQAY